MEGLVKHVRKFVLDHFLEQEAPPSLESIMRKFGLERAEAFGVLKELEAGRQLALLKGTQKILMAFPFSSIATPFRVTLRTGRKYYANCAWDSIAFHVMLNEDVKVESFCHHCAEDVNITMSQQCPVSVSPEGVLVYIGLPARKWWEDIVNNCYNNMTFFSTRSHLEEWLAQNPDQSGQSLTIEQTLKLSGPIYKDKMSIDYTRPPRDGLQAHFASLGLTSEFWKL